MIFSNEINKERRKQESNLFHIISQCCSKEELNSEDKEKLMTLLVKLDEMYLKRVKGAFVRSKATWMEEGEKNTSYFSNLEKKRQEYKTMTSLLINGKECKDIKII